MIAHEIVEPMIPPRRHFNRIARVLRDDGTPIPGLYATGTSTASVMGRTYPGAGCSIGPAFTWGYVAGKHALGIDKAA